MQEVKTIRTTDSKCSPRDNNESGDDEIRNEASTGVSIENIVQNEIILDDSSVEPVNLDDQSNDGTDPFVDVLAPDDMACVSDKDLSPKDDAELDDDEYVYMSDDRDPDGDVPYDENNDTKDYYLVRRPGPKSKTRCVQRVQEQPVTNVVSDCDKRMEIDLDGSSQVCVENSGIGRRSTRNATKLKTYEIDTLFAEQIGQCQSSRPKRIQRNNVRLKSEAIQEENERMEKNYFGTPLNAPFVDTSSDEDYFKPLNPEPRRDQRRQTDTWIRTWNCISADKRFRKKRKHIPDDVYFNPKTPLHVLYSYEGSSSEVEEEQPSTHVLLKNIQAPPISSRSVVRHQLRKMPPVHKIEAKKKKQTKKSATKDIAVHNKTVFQRLNDLKRMFKASGIKIRINKLVKGSKTFQERCERIQNCLQENGVRGRPTLAKCKRLKKQLKAEHKKARAHGSEVGFIATDNKPKPSETDEESNRNVIKPDADTQIEDHSAARNEFTENSHSKIVDGELKSEESVEPTNLVETILDTNESNNDAINQILNSELPNDLIECAVQSVDYFEQVRNI